MEVTVKKISRTDWKDLASQAHQAVFKEAWEADYERVDFALLTVDPENILVQYATIREIDSDSAYIQYGGSFPSYKGTIHSLVSFKAILRWLFERYTNVSFLTQNDNFAMLKFAIKEGFMVVGMRNFKGNVMLEHLKIKERK